MSITQLRKTAYRQQRRIFDFKERAAGIRMSPSTPERKLERLTQMAEAARADFLTMQEHIDKGSQSIYDTALGQSSAEARKTVEDMFRDGANVEGIAKYAVAVGDKAVLAELRRVIPMKAFTGQLPPPDDPPRAIDNALDLLYTFARTRFPEVDGALQELEVSAPYIRQNTEAWMEYFQQSAGVTVEGYVPEPVLYNWLGRPGDGAALYLPTDQELDEPPDEPAKQPSRPRKDLQDTGSQWTAGGITRTKTIEREPRSGDPGYF